LFAGVHFRSHRSVLFVFLTDAEPLGGATGGHWGTTLDRATLGVLAGGNRGDLRLQPLRER